MRHAPKCCSKDTIQYKWTQTERDGDTRTHSDVIMQSPRVKVQVESCRLVWPVGLCKRRQQTQLQREFHTWRSNLDWGSLCVSVYQATVCRSVQRAASERRGGITHMSLSGTDVTLLLVTTLVQRIILITACMIWYEHRLFNGLLSFHLLRMQRALWYLKRYLEV